MARDFDEYYHPELADPVKYIPKDICILIIKEQCSDPEERK
jgi:hypothetical protein